MISYARMPLAFAVAALSAVTLPAHADLVFLDEVQLQGTGLGTVNTVLTLQGAGGSSFEEGSVIAAGTGQATTGDASTGTSQSQLRTFADVGATSASDLLLVFNATEPGNDNAVSMQSLTLTFYDAAGATLYSASLQPPAGGLSINGTFQGIGNSGFLFGLDATQAAEAQATFGNDIGSVRIGLAAALSDVDGGQETFFLGSSDITTPIPEPDTYALLLAGIGAIGFMARRRRAA